MPGNSLRRSSDQAVDHAGAPPFVGLSVEDELTEAEVEHHELRIHPPCGADLCPAHLVFRRCQQLGVPLRGLLVEILGHRGPPSLDDIDVASVAASTDTPFDAARGSPGGRARFSLQPGTVEGVRRRA